MGKRLALEKPFLLASRTVKTRLIQLLLAISANVSIDSVRQERY